MHVYLGSQGRRRLASALVIIPALGLTLLALFRTYKDLTSLATSSQQSIAKLGAVILSDHFAQLSDLIISYSTRPHFTTLASQGQWEEAAQVLGDLHEQHAYIDRFFLTDASGVLRADHPALVPTTRGINFSHRNWYQGLAESGWKTHVSHVYRRTAEPRVNVVAVSAPIRDQDDRILGVLVFQVKLDALVSWSHSIERSERNSIYFVDFKGNLAAHPDVEPHRDLVNFSDHPFIGEGLSGLASVGTHKSLLGTKDHLIAFEPVEKFGWVALASEPTSSAFRARNNNLIWTALICLVLIGVIVLIVAMLLRTLAHLQSTTNQLNRSNLELEAFSYSVSHDLRAPLRSVTGFSAVILEDHKDEIPHEAQESLQRIIRAAKGMGILIDGLLGLSKVSRREMNKDVVNLSALTEDIAADLERREPERSVEFAVSPNIFVQGDHYLLRAVLVNLLENAWKFSSKINSAKIEFGVKKINYERVYFVRDNGAGFDMRYADKLFGTFQRLHSEHDFAGTGVGLATVQRIVHRHGGKIWAEAAPGCGATFYFTL